MPKPWEKYAEPEAAAPEAAKPWEKFAAPEVAPPPVAPQQKMAWGDVASQAIENIPGSALEFGESMLQPIMHPVQTAQDIYTLGSGLVQKLIPGEQENEAAVDAVASFLTDRYGDVESVKQTIAQDPVGVMADLSSLLTGGGGLLRGVGKVGKLGRVGEAGRVLSSAGAVADPLNILAKQPTRAVMAAVPERFAEKMYISGLKPSTKYTPEERHQLFQTAVKYDIPVSEKGAIKGADIRRKLGEQVGNVIAEGQARGETVGRAEVAARLEDLFDTYTKYEALPERGQRAVLSAMEEFYRSKGERIPVAEAQAMKQGVQRKLATKKAYGKMATPLDEAQKHLARGLRLELEKQYPELLTLNPQIGELSELDKVLQKALPRIQNWNMLGLVPTSAAAAGAAAGGSIPAVLAYTAAKIFDMPGVKSKLALALIKARGMDQFKVKGTPVRMGMYQAGKTSKAKKKAEDYLMNAKTYGFDTRTVRGKDGKIKEFEVQ